MKPVDDKPEFHPANVVYFAIQLGLRHAGNFGSRSQDFIADLNELALSALLTGATPEHATRAIHLLIEVQRYLPRKRGRPRKTVFDDSKFGAFVAELPRVASETGEPLSKVIAETGHFLRKKYPSALPRSHERRVRRALKIISERKRKSLALALLQGSFPTSDK